MKKRKIRKIPKTLPVKPQRIQNISLAIPQVEYKVIAQPILETAFTGHVTAIPTVLIFYLNPLEFKIVAVILQETVESGICLLSAAQLASRLKINIKSVYDNTHALKKMGIIYEQRQGFTVVRAIDFNAVQNLNDVLEEEDRGMYRRLRNKLRFKNINNITKEDLKRAYDKYVLPVDHDIEEEEEYD